MGAGTEPLAGARRRDRSVLLSRPGWGWFWGGTRREHLLGFWVSETDPFPPKREIWPRQGRGLMVNQLQEQGTSALLRPKPSPFSSHPPLFLYTLAW